MDASTVSHVPRAIRHEVLVRSLLLTAVVAAIGCEGPGLNVDNPVLGELPPRRSLVNSATLDTPAGSEVTVVPEVTTVSFSGNSTGLAGNAVVAEINGRPLFVDDLVGSVRLTIESDKSLSDDLRQQILKKEIRSRLKQRINEEIVLQALEAKIPEEQRDAIQEHLETGFQQYLEGLKSDQNLQSDKQLNEKLAQHGMSIGLLRESFFRIQMVNGFVQSLAENHVMGPSDRRELLEYYREHIDEFTPEERVRWQEIRVDFAAHGGRTQAEERMTEVVQEIQAGTSDFGELASQYSDSLSAENSGNMGWLRRGALTDKGLEEALFELPSDGMTKVLVRDRHFIVCRVARHEYARTRSFDEVQSEITQAILQQREQAARNKVIEELRESATVRTIFDDGRR